MQLSPLDTSHNHQLKTITTVESEITAKFRGKIYQVHPPVVTHATTQRQLKCSGIAY